MLDEEHLGLYEQNIGQELWVTQGEKVQDAGGSFSLNQALFAAFFQRAEEIFFELRWRATGGLLTFLTVVIDPVVLVAFIEGFIVDGPTANSRERVYLGRPHCFSSGEVVVLELYAHFAVVERKEGADYHQRDQAYPLRRAAPPDVPETLYLG
jgi:hypothetical protein